MTCRPARMRFCALTASLVSLGSATVAPVCSAQVRGWDTGLDAQLDSIRIAWRVPGMAVAVVSHGKVIHLAGYGLRDVEAKLPVTPATKFATSISIIL